ncbi:MAG: CBS domain-containing protein [Elusimicrobia bacterium]|nr:CBS domain-containing protein [Elusimicrobiota bacterium]
MSIDFSEVVVREIMRRKLSTLGPEDSLRDAAELFLRHGVTGAPVVDDDGRLLGVLSQTDLLRRGSEAARGQLSPFYREGEQMRIAEPVSVHDLSPVREAMSRDLVSVEEDVPVADVARLMAERGIHRVLVTRDGELEGIVTTMDIVRLVSEEAVGDAPKPPSSRRASRPRPLRSKIAKRIRRAGGRAAR